MIIAAGYAWRFFNPGGLDRHRARHGLSAAVLHFFLPALAFSLVATRQVDRSYVAIPAAAALVTLFCMGLGYAAYHLIPGLKRIRPASAAVLFLAAGFGNVTYLGLPVINEMLGESFGYVAVLYDLLATTPILLTLGVFIAARSAGGRAASFGESLKRVLSLPPLWGVAAGIVINGAGIRLPHAVIDAASLMGRAVIPVMIFTVGLALDFHDVKRLGIAVPALAIKMVLAPVLAWWAGSRLGLSGDVLKAVTIEGAMPVMVLSLVIADEFELDVQLAAACIAVSTTALFFTMPLVMNLLF